jgi:hypothetical protein
MGLRQLSALAILAALAAVMQGAAALWPGPGHALAALASLPLALAAWFGGRRATWCWVVAVLLLGLVHVQEAAIFGLMTGPVGLAAGWGLRHGWGWMFTSLLAGVVLTIGMLILAYVVGVPPLGPEVQAFGLATPLVYGLFSLGWGALWAWLTAKAVGRLGFLGRNYQVQGRSQRVKK